MNNNRVLVIDDDQSLLDMYRDILQPKEDPPDDFDAFTGSDEQGDAPLLSFDVVTTSQGEEGVEAVRHSLEENQPFAVAFVDVRMPPGIDGLEAALQIRALDKRIFIVIVTAYSDHSVQQIQEAIQRDVLLLRKPFSEDEVVQLAFNACNHWEQGALLQASWRNMEQRMEKLARAKGQFDNVLSTLVEGLIICDGDGTIQSINPTTTRLTGYAEAELSGLNVNVLFLDPVAGDPVVGDPVIKAFLNEILQDKEIPLEIEHTLRTRTGEKQPILISGTLVPNESQEASAEQDKLSIVLVLLEPSSFEP